MASWNESDIGKIIVYRTNSGNNIKIAICNFNKESSNILDVLEYPISLKSKFGPIGLIKNQEVKDENYLEKPGDWYFVGSVSSNEMNVLEKLASSAQDLLDSA